MCSVRIICYIYAEDFMAWRADGTNTEDKRCGEGHLKAGNGSGKRFGGKHGRCFSFPHFLRSGQVIYYTV